MSILEEPLYGDFEKGYYGTVSGLITNNDLSTLSGVTNGTISQSSGTDITFHKFIHKGRILLIARSLIRHGVSWDNIQAQNCVKGKVIEIQGKKYLCRLMTGSRHYYTSNASIAGGEWDDLFVHFHTSNGGPLTNEDLNITSTAGRGTICQEVHSSGIGNRIMRATGTATVDSISSGASTSSNGWRPVLELLSDRPLGIGSTTLIHGDETSGFYGEVNNLITGDQLRDITGVSQGTPMTTGDIDFLKFSSNNKTLFVAKQPIQHSISWDTLQINDCIFGKMIVIGNYVYLLRLIQGANASLTASTGGINDEWENLIVPIHISGAWGIYSDSDLGIEGIGQRTWVQEISASSLAYRLSRRGGGAMNSVISSSTGDLYSWRPVLELVGQIGENIPNKFLIKSEDTIYTLEDSEWVETELSEPVSMEDYINRGFDRIEDVFTLSFEKVQEMIEEEEFDSGKVFSSKVFPSNWNRKIREIEVKV